MEHKRRRVVFVAFGTRGDVQPLMVCRLSPAALVTHAAWMERHMVAQRETDTDPVYSIVLF